MLDLSLGQSKCLPHVLPFSTVWLTSPSSMIRMILTDLLVPLPLAPLTQSRGILIRVKSACIIPLLKSLCNLFFLFKTKPQIILPQWPAVLSLNPWFTLTGTRVSALPWIRQGSLPRAMALAAAPTRHALFSISIFSPPHLLQSLLKYLLLSRLCFPILHKSETSSLLLTLTDLFYLSLKYFAPSKIISASLFSFLISTKAGIFSCSLLYLKH